MSVQHTPPLTNTIGGAMNELLQLPVCKMETNLSKALEEWLTNSKHYCY